MTHPDASSRRAFVRNGALWLAATPAAVPAPAAQLRIALVTDVHYADKPEWGNRYYRESLPKMREAVGWFRNPPVDFAVELGDFIDAAESVEREAQWLKTIDAEFAKISPRRHYVLGNHCVWTLTKSEFLSAVGAKAAHYSFDYQGWHFVVLDACYKTDGTSYGRRNFEWTDTDIPETQREWLKADLAKAAGRTVVFVHQRLDVTGAYAVRRASLVRSLLESSRKVALVLQGHFHKNDLKEIHGIPYVTLAAMIEGSGEVNNAYSVLELSSRGAAIHGWRRQTSRDFAR